MSEILQVELRDDRDVVLARQRARRVAALLGFESQNQARISTALSEIARNAVMYGGGGMVEFEVQTGQEPELILRISDRGPGIPELQPVLDGQIGTGAGLAAARRIMDRFEIDTSSRGTIITLAKSLPRKSPLDSRQIEQIRQELVGEEPQSVYEEFASQNQELLRALDELRKQQATLAQVNAELEETNRGVVALYSDLEEKAKSLQKLNQQRSRFYSSMSHEFRTPINSIISLSNILLGHLDGDLSVEQTKQVSLIQNSAKNLLDWITDLLDIAKVEAGKLEVKPSEFVVADLLTSLRGVMRPLFANPAVEFIVEDPEDEIVAYTDDGKLAQILRNFVSNAIKFTESGEIRVRAERIEPSDLLEISVTDTGIGIASEYHSEIFEEFIQVENPLQGRVRGTGLGLSLSKQLAELLGGQIYVRSQPGQGSTFSLQVPRIVRSAAQARFDSGGAVGESALSAAFSATFVLVIDDDEASRYVAKQILMQQGLAVAEACGGREGLALAKTLHPQAIVLDLAMPDMDGFEVFEALQSNPLTAQIPVILRTSKPIEVADRLRLKGAIDIISKNPETGFMQLQRAIRSAGLVGAKPATEVEHA
jgi:signal transduction histidine kinase/CheY-like chemotaxis protein